MFKTLAVLSALGVAAVAGVKAVERHHHVHANIGPTVVTVKVPDPLPASGGQPSGGGNLYVP
jgi:hypothetical protein